MSFDPFRKPVVGKRTDSEVWRNMVDSIIDFLAASRAMLQILTEKIAAVEQERIEDKRSVDDRIRERFLNGPEQEYFHITENICNLKDRLKIIPSGTKGCADPAFLEVMYDARVPRMEVKYDTPRMEMKYDTPVRELHVNKLFNEKSESNSKGAYFENRLHEKFANAPPKPRTDSEFLDKQFNLAKQAIARRYQPQGRIVPVTKSDNESKREHFIETFTEGLHRIGNVASESVQLRKNYDEVHFRTSGLNSAHSSSEKTYVLYEKF